jgi:hypothetical protein
MQTLDGFDAPSSESIAAELLERINAAYAALDGWPQAFRTADIESVRRTLPALIALSTFLEDQSDAAIAIIGSVALEVWSGSDYYCMAGRSFVAGDVTTARSNWEAGNAAWAKAAVAPA